MNRAKKIRNIVIHCSAGYGNVEAIKRYWHEKLGWKNPGYHRLIDLDGTVHKTADFETVANGVKWHNHNSIHISYIGGVLHTNYAIAKDTRTQAQKNSIIKCILEAYEWLGKNGNDLQEVRILGHRDFSPDKNGDGVVNSWERIKECPSFDAIPEYRHIQEGIKHNITWL